ncbi:lantibiotic dehydratase [Mucilaginibacter sp. KACC 22773]|uniref:lantibiotic dehydratase n=1 Tax=Mucilaginibacter sp. KACC 22773 TaxID=3025671 RepID=UPI00236593A1|nr:lantibiotic dehydratase [Mucilaginibacter sp. KACC 22773]WDF79007.1 lantibiotic dehydratase [Mucilaginibacter sp. KACC 22773]
MRYTFANHLLLRMPVKNQEDYIGDTQLFLDDLHFRSAVFLASPAFYETLEKQQFVTIKLSAREEGTLKRYINRYCFRPTPFGMFASVSLTEWKTDSVQPLFETQAYQTHLYTDQTYQAKISQILLNGAMKTKARFESNPSLYRVLNEYRFFRTGIDESFKQREYLLQAIAFSKLLKDLIAFCIKGRTLPEITGHIRNSAGCSLTEAIEYADFLIDSQLLVNCLRQHITGPDYLDSLLKQPQFLASERGLQLQKELHSLSEILPNPDNIQWLNKQLQAFLPREQALPQTNNFSAILQKKSNVTGPAIRWQEMLRDGIYALDLLAPIDQLPAMDHFMNSFQQHFEGQSLPLLIALDPEAGIGYQQEAPDKRNPLLETLHIHNKPKPGPSPGWTPAQGLLLKSWLRAKQEPLPVIELNTAELQELQTSEGQQTTGMSVLFRIYGDQLFIESAGGSNAPALIGRFTVIDEAIFEAARNMAQHVERQNPQLLFAELLHLSDPHVDNVNRRKNIYSYEIPVTAASSLQKDHQLELADLYIRVVQNKVVLFSKKHGKQVIPRLSSAYNHSLNKLPLFRFLADLPYQYGRFNLSLDLRQYFPGQEFYPRVVYRNTILYLATWVLTKDEIAALQQESFGKALMAFQQLSKKVKLCRTFSLVEGDQQLVFDQESEDEIAFFCSCIRQKTEVILKEFIPQPEIRQYNAFVLPAEPLASTYGEIKQSGQRIKIKRKYLPGSEWLYLKIYAPRPGAAGLLLRLQPLLNKRYSHGKISKWFFIRYDDHAPHIRLRLKVAPEDISEVLLAFKAKLEDRIQQHVIREYQIEVYTRELERYAEAGIEKTEDFFWSSSELVLYFLKKNRYDMAGTAHHFAIVTVQSMIKVFLTRPDDQLAFTLESYQQFLPEFAEGKVKVELDKKYRELSGGIYSALNANDKGLLSGSLRAGQRFISIVKEINEILSRDNSDKLNYLRSVIHMHLNRLFTDEPRKQEMITYYLIYKYLLSLKSRSKN